ncbi:hypothetical protein RB653_003611 [Dictyostelium firmibasis]|uniref:Uncharacterized protein n=1 Tax=Dictyostelium firmibasis TaxID=79012 RepID=A0AAN7TY59_9MYCE
MTMIKLIINIGLNKNSKTFQINKIKNENNLYCNNLVCTEIDVDFHHQNFIGNLHLNNRASILPGIYYNL